MNAVEVLECQKVALNIPKPERYFEPFDNNPLFLNRRPFSLSLEDAFFGDSGKGTAVYKANERLGKNRPVFSIRYNGGANAGHELNIDGKNIAFHLLPVGVATENTTALISRGMLLHPQDLITELNIISNALGGKFRGKLIIDERVPLGLDTHRAEEKAYKSATKAGEGSTNKGIATGYMSLLRRDALTIKDLMGSDWKEKFSRHYDFIKTLVTGFLSEDFEDIQISVLGSAGKSVNQDMGTKNEFLDRLEEEKEIIRPFVKPLPEIYQTLQEVWKNRNVAITLEGAQGAGLDLYNGVYPDVTSSQPMSRNVNSATYNLIKAEDIAMRVGVMKATYMSSVGSRVLPTEHNLSHETWIQETFSEVGKSTGRLRDIYPVSIPIGQYLKMAAGYDWLFVTHLDSSKKDIPIRIVANYTNENEKESPYLPYQDELDKLRAHFIEFPGWDGEMAKNASEFKDLPENALRYLLFLSQTLSPVVFASQGAQLDRFLSR